MTNSKIQFNSINASSLFHFTRKYTSFKSILTNGLRLSFSFEPIPTQIIENFIYPSNCKLDKNSSNEYGVAIPMICFCDIPIVRAPNHIKKYGKYMIGLDKKLLHNLYYNKLNPVIYVNSKEIVNSFIEISEIYKETQKYHQDLCNNSQLVSDGNTIPMLGLRMFSLENIFGFYKPMCDEEQKNNYYNEREWRVCSYNNKKQSSEWKWGITKQEYNDKCKEWNNCIAKDFDNHLTLYGDDIRGGITHIVVSTESKVDDMTEFILKSPKIFGYSNVSKETRLYLISKITSMERIALDY